MLKKILYFLTINLPNRVKTSHPLIVHQRERNGEKFLHTVDGIDFQSMFPGLQGQETKIYDARLSAETSKLTILYRDLYKVCYIFIASNKPL